MTHRRSSLTRSIQLVATAALGIALSGSDCLSALLSDCGDACDAISSCDIQGQAACLLALCDEDGAVRSGTEDIVRCVEGAAESDANCLVIASCGCDAGCDRIDECTGDPDPQCVETCDTIVEQEPEDVFKENVCIAGARSCDDLALCTSVGG